MVGDIALGALGDRRKGKYASHCLAAFAYRFNRRFDLRTLIARLIVDVSRCVPITEKLIRTRAETHVLSGSADALAVSIMAG